MTHWSGDDGAGFIEDCVMGTLVITGDFLLGEVVIDDASERINNGCPDQFIKGWLLGWDVELNDGRPEKSGDSPSLGSDIGQSDTVCLEGWPQLGLDIDQSETEGYPGGSLLGAVMFDGAADDIEEGCSGKLGWDDDS